MSKPNLWTVPLSSLLARPKVAAMLERLRKVKQIKVRAKLEARGEIRQ